MEDQGSSWKLTLAYDGSGFSGSQRQANGRSVQGELERVLERLAGRPTPAVFAGRTDKGVHAIGQVAGIAGFRDDLAPDRLRAALNDQLPRDMSVVDASRIDHRFHPRYDAAWREYRYRIWAGHRQPLLERTAWQRRDGFDLAAAQAAATRLLGTHDLAAFAGMGQGVPWSGRRQQRRGTVRTVMRCSVRAVPAWWGAAPDTGSGIEIRVVADGFLPNMVRTISAALTEVASGARSPAWVDALLQARDRRQGPQTAPPQGLILWKVGYGDDVPDPEPDEVAGTGTIGQVGIPRPA